MRIGIAGAHAVRARGWLTAVRHVENAHLVGLWDVDHGRTLATAKSLATQAFATLDDMLDQVDAVVCVAEPIRQAALATKIVQAGKHILFGLPLSLDLEAGRAFEKTVTASSVVAMGFTEELFDPDQRLFLDFQQFRHVEEGSLTWTGHPLRTSGPGERALAEVPDLLTEVLARAVPQFEWVFGPVTWLGVSPGREQTRWEVTLGHARDRVSSVYIETPATSAGLTRRYEFRAGTKIDTRESLGNGWVAAVAALEELGRSVGAGSVSVTSSWSTTRCVRATEIAMQIKAARAAATLA